MMCVEMVGRHRNESGKGGPGDTIFRIKSSWGSIFQRKHKPVFGLTNMRWKLTK